MSTALIIPIHNQSSYWSRMISAIEAQSVIPDAVYVLLDRPRKSEYRYITGICNRDNLKANYKVVECHQTPSYMGRPQSSPDDNFLAGYVRNIGVDLALKDGHETFIFIDGDCIPEMDLVKSHNQLNENVLPNLSVGRRRDINHDWKDQREIDPTISPSKLFSSGNGFVIHNPDLILTSSIVWTCNVSMNLNAVKLIKRMNLKYYERDELFNSEFCGSWGGEDAFLGFQAYSCRVFITMCSDELAGIRHIDHPRPESKYGDDWGKYFLSQVDDLQVRLSLEPLLLDFYITR
jgi:hypothetical protein